MTEQDGILVWILNKLFKLYFIYIFEDHTGKDVDDSLQANRYSTDKVWCSVMLSFTS